MKPDKTPLTEEQRKLVEQFQYLPRYWFYKIWPRPELSGVVKVCGQDEILSEGTWCLIRCAKAFDPSRGIKFISYASRAIACQMKEAYIKTFIIHAGRKGDGYYWRKAYSLNANLRRIERFGDETWQPTDESTSPFDEACKKDEVELLTRALKKLPGRQYEAVQMHYIEGKTLSECGEIMGMTKEGVRLQCKNGMETLKKRLAKFKTLV